MSTSSKNQKMNRLTNYMEELADGVLDDIVTKHHENFSPNALQDIKALALNRLWPM